MSSKKRPIETITLDDSDDGEYSPPPPHASTSGQARAIAVQEQFDLDTQRALQASLEMEEKEGKSRINQQVKSMTSTEQGGTGTLSGISRAEMERERLERIKKRQGNSTAPESASTSQLQSTSKRARIATLSDLPSTEEAGGGETTQKPSFGSNESSNRFHSRLSNSTSTPSPSSFSSSSHSATSQRFFSGSIRRVPNVHHPDPTSSTSLSFSSLIGPPSSLLACIVSAFVLSPQWVVPQFPQDIPLLLIMPRAKGDVLQREATKVQVGDKRHLYRVIPEDNSSGFYQGCMHTKLMVRTQISLSCSPRIEARLSRWISSISYRSISMILFVESLSLQPTR